MATVGRWGLLSRSCSPADLPLTFPPDLKCGTGAVADGKVPVKQCRSPSPALPCPAPQCPSPLTWRVEPELWHTARSLSTSVEDEAKVRSCLGDRGCREGGGAVRQGEGGCLGDGRCRGLRGRSGQ